MGLVTSTEMFKKAYEGKYAVGAFNVNDMEIIQGIVEAAQEEQAPLILQVSAGARKYANPVYLKKLLKQRLKPQIWISACIWTTAQILKSVNPVLMEALPLS